MPALDRPDFDKSPRLLLDETIEAVDQLDSMVFAICQAADYSWKNTGRPIAEASNKISSLLAKTQIFFELCYTDETVALMDEFIEYQNKRQVLYAENEVYNQTIKELARLKLRGEEKKWVEIVAEEVEQYDIDEKNRVLEIESELARLTNAFNNNFQQSIMNWQMQITDARFFEGLRSELVDQFRDLAESRNQKGWLIHLNENLRNEIVASADSQELRRVVHYAFNTIATDHQPSITNNIEIIDKILRLRHEYATLLGHGSFAEYALSDMNITKPERIIRLFKRLDKFVDKKAKEELDACKEHLSNADWSDVTYLRYKEYEKAHPTGHIRDYLNTEDTFHRMLDYFGKVFRLKFVKTEAKGIHESNAYYEVYREGRLIGSFFTDLYDRSDKIAMCAVYQITSLGYDSLPVYFYILDYQETMSHGDLVIMLHEFGHLMHGLLNRCPYHSMGGYESLRVDGVEFPSQFMENFAWHKPTLEALCRHYETNLPPDDRLLSDIIKSRTLVSGAYLQDYIKRALADLIMHHEYCDVDHFATSTMLEVYRRNGLTFDEWNSRILGRFHHTFGSIAGYESAYYVYVWSELYARDAFERFARKRSIESISEEMQRFISTFFLPTRDNFLKQFKSYMGRPMSEEAWFKFYGIT